MLFFLLFIGAKTLLNSKTQHVNNSFKALFVIKTYSPTTFTLTDDDQSNIITKVTANKYRQLELCLLNPTTNQFYQYIPPTSERAFLHLVKIERPLNRKLLKVNRSFLLSLHLTKRIEFFEYSKNQWVLSDANQDNFNLFQFIIEENTSLSPFLLHYLLILILALLGLDLGIKYRILKI